MRDPDIPAPEPLAWREVLQADGLACTKLRMSFGVLEDIVRLPLQGRLAKRLWLEARGLLHLRYGGIELNDLDALAEVAGIDPPGA